MTRWCILLLAIPLLVAAAMPAGVRAEVDGHALARAWCASCHAVEPGELAGPVGDIPSFTAVARLPSTTVTALHAFLTTPHGDMPDIKLSPDEIGAVVNYILSLKRR